MPNNLVDEDQYTVGLLRLEPGHGRADQGSEVGKEKHGEGNV